MVCDTVVYDTAKFLINTKIIKKSHSFKLHYTHQFRLILVQFLIYFRDQTLFV